MGPDDAMTMDPELLQHVVEELQPVVGGRIQRIDLIAEREIVLEVRCPGRTVRLLASARPFLGRFHAVLARGEREIQGGALQAVLRQRLAGRPLVALSAEGRTVSVAVPDSVLRVRLDGGRDAIRVESMRIDSLPARVQAELPPRFVLSEEAAADYEQHRPRASSEALRAVLLARLRSRAKKLERLVTNLEADRERLSSMQRGAAAAELMKPMLSRLRRGQSEVEVIDHATQQTVRIRLDPRFSPKDNMTRLFERAKKGHRGLPRVEVRLAKTRQELDEVLRTAEEVTRAASVDLRRWALPVEGEGHAEHSRPSDSRPGSSSMSRSRAGDDVHSPEVPARGRGRRGALDRCARRFVAVDGAEILVGRGAKENDRLTLSFTRGDDLWLHARGTSGAHVVLRTSGGRSPNPEAVLDAAHLAVHYSGSKNEPKVEVTVTQARHVRKTKGDPPGRVGVARDRTLLLVMEPERLRRLLGHGE